MRENPSIRQLEEYQEKYGKRAASTLGVLGKLVGFVEAIKSPLGLELLKDDIERVDELLEKMILENITPQELAELRYLKNQRLPKVTGRISTFLKLSKEVADGSKKNT
jgi:hypothetical protein